MSEIYKIAVPDLPYRIIDRVVDEVREIWCRPVDSVYPVIFLDAIVDKVRPSAR